MRWALLLVLFFASGSALRIRVVENLGLESEAGAGGNDTAAAGLSLPAAIQEQEARLSEMQERAKETMAKQQRVIDGRLKQAHKLRTMLARVEGDISQRKTWVRDTQRKVDQLENQKSKIKIEWELDRMKPLLSQASEREKKFTTEQQRWRSSKTALETKAEALQQHLQRIDSVLGTAPPEDEEGGGGGDGSSAPPQPTVPTAPAANASASASTLAEALGEANATAATISAPPPPLAVSGDAGEGDAGSNPAPTPAPTADQGDSHGPGDGAEGGDDGPPLPRAPAPGSSHGGEGVKESTQVSKPSADGTPPTEPPG